VRGLSGEDIDRLADDREKATERFIDWAIRLRRAAGPYGLVTGLDEGELQGCAVASAGIRPGEEVPVTVPRTWPRRSSAMPAC
jgi:hypothetical protein